MNLLPKTNNNSADSEYDMQSAVAGIMASIEFLGQTPTGGDRWERALNVYREVRIPAIDRVSDIIVEITPRKIVNIECKLFDHTGVIIQALDHLFWADYSYVCIHSKAYLPEYAIRTMLRHGVGLMMWSKRTGLVDVFGASHNTFTGGKKDKRVREKVKSILKKKDPISLSDTPTLHL